MDGMLDPSLQAIDMDMDEDSTNNLSTKISSTPAQPKNAKKVPGNGKEKANLPKTKKRAHPKPSKNVKPPKKTARATRTKKIKDDNKDQDDGKENNVEQTVSANLCVLSPRSLDKMSQEVLQKARPVRASEVEIDDPRLPEIQTTEHAEHVKIALSYRRKEYSRRKADQRSEGSSKELTELIDANARAIAANVKAAMSINARKRKALNAECPVSKRRRVTLGKYRLKRVKRTEKASLLRCFDRRGGPAGQVHTHEWWALI
ncbi:hypothetical protein PCASD_03057 [Puccinia coronata f. sp. avenae]|uniref:Uncharacterized protein n=1 Tax=Puccinia coronata f. sp. avenae TaxID=200324 RepID=A0A2N5RV14_9BASI|nr:hypothetical protein PCASD_26879 [Puccinia coronata f. sp. avenae]PLW49109.1 hypothetical protein PCASD_03057 [Puccinia coronata f. sp. avenae]